MGGTGAETEVERERERKRERERERERESEGREKGGERKASIVERTWCKMYDSNNSKENDILAFCAVYFLRKKSRAFEYTCS